MALFHLNVSSIGKSSGSSAVAAAAYRSCSQLNQYLYDEINGLSSSFIHNYAHKKGLAFSQIFAPDNSDSWVYNRQTLWNKIEEHETRKDARYARDIKIALQKEFTLEQNIQILSEYVSNVFVKEGIIADVNIHIDNENNPHAHIMLTTRKLIQNEKGEWVFGNKNRLLDTKGWIKNIREEWALINNHYFALYDIDKSISAESYETRGLGFMNSTIHEGAATHSEKATERVLDRTEYNRNAVFKNLEYIKNNPSEVIMAVIKDKSKASTVFNKENILNAIESFLDEIAVRDISYSVLISEIRSILEVECNLLFERTNNMSLGNLFSDRFDSSVRNERNYDINHNVTEYFSELFDGIKFDNIRNQKSFDIDTELEYIKQNKDKIIKSLNSKRAIFTKVDIAKLLDAYINKNIISELEARIHDDSFINEVKTKITKEYSDILLSFMNSKELVKIADKDLSGNEIYTTTTQIQLEREFLDNLEELNSKSNHVVESQADTLKSTTTNYYQNVLASKLAKILPNDGQIILERIVNTLLGKDKSYTLTHEQEEAVQKLLNSRDIVALSGMPGTGKSTVMERVAREYKDRGYQVLGGSLSAVAALNLGNEAHIVSHTLSKWQYDWNLRDNLEAKKEKIRDLLPTLTNKTVFIVDEMSMVDLPLANYISSKVKAAGAKLICIFDNNQFSSIGVGGASEKIAEVAENISLTELFRQRSTLDKDITRKLSTYKVDEAIKTLDNEGRIKLGNNSTIIRQELVDRYVEKICSSEFLNKNSSVAIISYKNEEVKELNLLVRDRLLSSGLLYTRNYNGKDKGGQEFIGSRGKMAIAIDERIVFTKNHKTLGVLNGQLGKVIEIIDDRSFKVELLDEKSQSKRLGYKNSIVIVNNEKFTHFDYGYAITAHKSQGKTYDYIYVLLGSYVGYESFYVMATRHRYNSEFYIDKNCLNDIILRKFDKHSASELIAKSIHQNNNVQDTTNNQKAALYELLVKRAPRSFAHDFIDYEERKEVVQIREYLESRDTAASVYRELLDWQSAIKDSNNDINNKENRTPNLWENEKLWSQFTRLTTQRKVSAEELVENYVLYQKYIDPSVINYATLTKHSGKGNIAFDYNGSDNQVDNYQSKMNYNSSIDQETLRNYDKIVELADGLATSYNTKLAKNIVFKSEELIALHQEQQLNLERVASKITSLENGKWLLESQKNACEYYCKDFSKFLDETYKEGSKEALDNWNNILKQQGMKQALINIEKNPELLGNIAGMGVGQKLAISDKRAIALFNLKTLATRLEKYESSTEQEKQLEIQIIHIETKELAELKTHYNQLSKTQYLSHNQEKYLQNIIDNKQDLRVVVKSQEKEVTGRNASYQKVNHISNKLSYVELHNKLSDNAIEISKELLPSISNKPIEVTKHSIKCGSINISLDSKTKGLWCRFSRENEKGDLFDLIKISKGMSSKQEAMNWSKLYLGLEGTKTLDLAISAKELENNNSKINKKEDNIKILFPVPNDAITFNSERLFMYKLKDKNKVIESVYTYKNINHELCGYVVRIKDIESQRKETLPVVYAETSKGIRGWKSRGFGDNRCLYNEHVLVDSTKPVLIVEGEKTADAAQKLYPEFDVVSWSGGVNAVNKSNWSVLKDKEVIIWPDNDQAVKKGANAIKTLLEEQSITKANVVDIKKIEFLPEKWDLADEIPEDVRQHQITGALLQAQNNVTTDQRVERILNDFIEHRQNELNKDLSSAKINDLSEYILKNEQIRYQFKEEVLLAKNALLDKELLSTTDEIFIAMEAEKEVDKKLSMLTSVENKPNKDIEKIIVSELADTHHNISKDNLIEISKIAISHVNQLISDHNSNQKNINVPKIKSAKINESILAKNVLPVLALSFAEKVLIHNEEYNKNHEDALHKSANLSVNLDHTANIVKNSFKLQIAHDTMNYELHHQQQMQRQVNQHNSIEM